MIPTGKGIICVVDDDVSILKALVRLLRAAGFEAVSFENPGLFLEYAKDYSVSLAIVDLREVAVIIITEYESAADRNVALAQGAIAFLLKPVRDSELLDAISKAWCKPPTSP